MPKIHVNTRMDSFVIYRNALLSQLNSYLSSKEGAA